MPRGLQYLYAPPPLRSRTGAAAEMRRVCRRLVSDNCIEGFPTDENGDTLLVSTLQRM
jgi:hypothetical protein